MQWASSLERLGVNTDVVTLSSFRARPREGHLDKARQLVSYLTKFKHTRIRIRTEEPDFSSMPITPYDWEESVCGKVTELLPEDSPEPKGKHVATVSYHDKILH